MVSKLSLYLLVSLTTTKKLAVDMPRKLLLRLVPPLTAGKFLHAINLISKSFTSQMSVNIRTHIHTYSINNEHTCFSF